MMTQELTRGIQRERIFGWSLMGLGAILVLSGILGGDVHDSTSVFGMLLTFVGAGSVRLARLLTAIAEAASREEAE